MALATPFMAATYSHVQPLFPTSPLVSTGISLSSQWIYKLRPDQQLKVLWWRPIQFWDWLIPLWWRLPQEPICRLWWIRHPAIGFAQRRRVDIWHCQVYSLVIVKTCIERQNNQLLYMAQSYFLHSESGIREYLLSWNCIDVQSQPENVRAPHNIDNMMYME